MRLQVVEADDTRIIPGKLLSVDEMAAIPFPTKKEFDETAFDPRLLYEFPIITARGCPYRCVFCKDGFGLRQSTVRYYPVDYVVDYLECIQKTWGFRRSQVLDDIFLSSVSRMEEMAAKLEERKLTFKFNCMVHAMFMIGNIGETVDSIKQTIQFAHRLPVDRAWFSFAAPYPGTPFYDMVSEYGEILEPDFAKWNQRTLVYKPKDVSIADMHRLMRWAQAVRISKKIRHTAIGAWEAPLRKALSGLSAPVRGDDFVKEES